MRAVGLQVDTAATAPVLATGPGTADDDRKSSISSRAGQNTTKLLIPCACVVPILYTASAMLNYTYSSVDREIERERERRESFDDLFWFSWCAIFSRK